MRSALGYKILEANLPQKHKGLRVSVRSTQFAPNLLETKGQSEKNGLGTLTNILLSTLYIIHLSIIDIKVG